MARSAHTANRAVCAERRYVFPFCVYREVPEEELRRIMMIPRFLSCSRHIGRLPDSGWLLIEEVAFGPFCRPVA